jgi:hypothetical protein
MSILFPIFEIRFLPFVVAFLLSMTFALALLAYPYIAWLRIALASSRFFC